MGFTKPKTLKEPKIKPERPVSPHRHSIPKSSEKGTSPKDNPRNTSRTIHKNPVRINTEPSIPTPRDLLPLNIEPYKSIMEDSVKHSTPNDKKSPGLKKN